MSQYNLTKIIAYYRVSTQKQGRSGLGLEAQQVALKAFAERNGATIVAEYTEIETGKKSDRPQLQQAIAHTRSAEGTLVVAKLDRLARNVAFLGKLMESGVEFLAVDNQHANRMTLYILMAVAEEEARLTSQRTKDALAALKARGVKLGAAREGHCAGKADWRGWREGVKNAAKAREERTKAHYQYILQTIQVMREHGRTYQEICNLLNEQGHLTSAGKPFTETAISRLIARYLDNKYLGANTVKIA
jgi:DNA invertase Pin-like site-specific DNA recombinase